MPQAPLDRRVLLAPSDGGTPNACALASSAAICSANWPSMCKEPTWGKAAAAGVGGKDPLQRMQ